MFCIGDFRRKASQISFKNVEGLQAGNVQTAIEILHDRINSLEESFNSMFDKELELLGLRLGTLESDIDSTLDFLGGEVTPFDNNKHTLADISNRTVNIENEIDLAYAFLTNSMSTFSNQDSIPNLTIRIDNLEQSFSDSLAYVQSVFN